MSHVVLPKAMYVLGPKIFNINVRSQPMVFKKCMFSTSSFADDSNGRRQFALTFQFNVINKDIVNCLKQIIEWSNAHFMKINPNKTEIALLCPSSLNDEIIIKGVIFEGQCIRFSAEVKNVGVWLDRNLRMDKHINQISSHCYKILKDIGRIRKCITQSHLENLVHAVISTRLDYCNSLFMKISKENIFKLYLEIRNNVTPEVDIRRKVDACESISKDLLRFLYDRMVDEEFDELEEHYRLRELRGRDTSQSIFGPQSQVSHHSKTASVVAIRAAAAADLAAKEAEYEALAEEQKKKNSIRDLEEHQMRDLEAQKEELEQLQAKRVVKIARAKLKAYDQAVQEEAAFQDEGIAMPNIGDNVTSKATHQSETTTLKVHPDVLSLTQAFQSSMVLNRLPIPEPFIFSLWTALCYSESL